MTICLASSLSAFAQSIKTTKAELIKMAHYSPEYLSSVYHVYPTPSNPVYSPVPKGYEPVFISHYGRHGSRFLTEDKRYTDLIGWFEAQELTEIGKEIVEQMKLAWRQAEGRGGDLTEVGEMQHRGIAQRMFENFPKLFEDDTKLKVYSSTSRRCMMSMMYFCETLKERNPKLQFERDVCEKNMSFIKGDLPELKTLMTPTHEAYKTYVSFRDKTFRPEAFLKRVFVHPDKVDNVFRMIEQFYLLAQNMQDCGHPAEMLSYLTTDEIYNQWSIKNVEMYLANGDSPLSDGIPNRCADALLKQIIMDADSALLQQRRGATLRFGHDTSLIRLLTRLGVMECSAHCSDMNVLADIWQDGNISPMAANLQIIFYQNKSGNTLIKLLLNENEVHLSLPAKNGVYYDWEEVKRLV